MGPFPGVEIELNLVHFYCILGVLTAIYCMGYSILSLKGNRSIG